MNKKFNFKYKKTLHKKISKNKYDLRDDLYYYFMTDDEKELYLDKSHKLWKSMKHKNLFQNLHYLELEKENLERLEAELKALPETVGRNFNGLPLTKREQLEQKIESTKKTIKDYELKLASINLENKIK
ncbi:MAG: hypothetical protein ACRCRR_04285 [Rickettsia sp.]